MGDPGLWRCESFPGPRHGMQAAGGSTAWGSSEGWAGPSILTLYVSTGRSDTPKLGGLEGTHVLRPLICWPECQGHRTSCADSVWHSRHTPHWGMLPGPERGSLISSGSIKLFQIIPFPLNFHTAGCYHLGKGDFSHICIFSRQSICSMRALLLILPE